MEERFLPETTQAIVHGVPIIPLLSIPITDFFHRHLGAWFPIAQKKLCYQNQFLTASCQGMGKDPTSQSQTRLSPPLPPAKKEWKKRSEK